MQLQQVFRSVLIAVVIPSVCAVGGAADRAADLRVGVYNGFGCETGIIAGLADVEGMDVHELGNLGATSLSECHVVIWPHSGLKPNDHARPWRLLLNEYVNRGGGLILTHIGAGGFRGVAKDEPLFPQIAVNTGRREFTSLHKLDRVDHPVAAGLPVTIRHSYYDHMIMEPGPDGRTLYVDEQDNAVVLAGPVGGGRVVIMGNLPGYKGTKVYGADGLADVSDEGPTTLEGGELALVVQSVQWAAESLRKTQITPGRLAETLEAAVDRLIAQPDAAAGQPIMVFNTSIPGNYLDPNIWDYAPKGPGANKWGTWYGGAASGPPYNMHLSTSAVDQPITSKRFERSPVKGRFLFTGEAILSRMYAGILEWWIIDETANKDIQDGYGIRLVFGGLEEKTPGYAFRQTRKSYEVKIGDARHAILKLTRGKVTQLAAVPGSASGRLMSPAEGEKRVPVRFERTDDGELILSVGGTEAARVTDKAYDNFTKLRAVMTTPWGRLGFDNPKLVGYFADAGPREYAPTPWIVPAPKQIDRNGQTFTLTDGAQFVVSSRSKIDTYLLDEWIIPEIRGRFGIKIRAATLGEVDRSKPAIYLGESSDAAFAGIFDSRLKAITGNDPGPEGHAILVTGDTAQAAGATERGTFWALQSLVQLIERDGDLVRLRGAYVRDWPDFKLRGSVSNLWSRKDRIQSNMDRALTCVRMFARYKANAIMLGSKYVKFPSYDLSGYGCQWSFDEMAEIYKLCAKYHMQVIPVGYSLCHAGLRVDFYLSRTNPELWKWIVDNKILADDLSNKLHYSADSFNATNPLALEMCRKLNQDFMDISPDSKWFMTPFDEINPPIHTYAPEGTEADLLVEWITKCYQHMTENGRRMVMFPSYITEAAKFPGSSASLGRTGGEGMGVFDIASRIPKDIIMADWYYGTSPDRAIYKHLRDKGFDVIAIPGPCYGYPYDSFYHAAVEGKKAGVLGLLAYGYEFGAYINPQQTANPMAWINGWTVPDKMQPDWCWQEHWQDVFQGVLPSHTGEVVPVDISGACNESRIDDRADDGSGWLDYGRISDLRRLAPGETVFRQYRFNVVDEAANNGKSVIVVSRRKGEELDEAGRVTGVPVGRTAGSLVFLHAGTSLGPVWVSDFCTYRVNYEGGTSVALPVKYGHQAGPWIYAADTGHPRLNNFYRSGYLSWCRLIKTGRTAMGEETGLYAYEWVNPNPGKRILSIDMEVSVDRDIRIALVALSAVDCR